MKLIEALEQTKSDYVIIIADGYEEGRFMPTYQPFRSARKFRFTVKHFLDGDAYVEHPTFICGDDSTSADWEIVNGIPQLYTEELFTVD